MTAGEIARIVAELSPLIVNGVVMRVREPMADHLAISVRKEGRNVEFVVGVRAGLARLHLATWLPPTPPGPSPFAQRARKWLRPSRVTAVTQLPDERVVKIGFSRHAEAGGGWQVTLVAELFGRGRMLLLDEEDRVLAAHGPGGARGLVTGEAYAPPVPTSGSMEDQSSTGDPADSAGIEARYEAWLDALDTDAAGQRAASSRKKARRRVERRIAAMERDLEKLSGWPELAREAELLAAHRHLLKKGMTCVTVTDWHEAGTPERVISLAPDKTPEEQIDDRFKRAKKSRGGIGPLTERIAAARAELAEIQAREQSAGDPGTAPELSRETARPPLARSKKAAGGRFRKFVREGGWEIYVGRSDAENDRLTFTFARGNDLWFHARDTPGSHVVLRGEGTPPQGAVLDAALLAAHYSKLKKEGGGEVTCTQRKYIKRPKKGKPGQVLLSREKVIRVRLDPKRIETLRDGRG